MISLRNAIATANSSADPTTITFDPTVFATAQTITLTGSALEINSPTKQAVTIEAPAAGVTVDGNNASGGFTIDTAANLSGLTVTHCNTTGVNIQAGSNVPVNLTGCLITDNHEGASASSNGGGLAANGLVTLTNVTVSNNSASNNGSGGGIFADGGTLTMNQCTVSNNTAGDIGGGIYVTTTVTLNDVIVTNNTGYEVGGIGNYYTLTVNNSTISNNTATNGTGGISNYYGTVALSNSTVADNTVTTQGVGGVNFFAGQATISDCTIAGNTSGSGTGGVQSSALTIVNSIVAGNSIIGGGASDASGTITSDGYNLVGATDGSTGWFSLDLTGTAASPLDAMLGSLADNGGGINTMLPLDGSPAIDHGFNALIAPGLSTDQRGLARIRNGTVDIGAVEVQTGSTTPVVTATTTTLQSSEASATFGDSITFTTQVASSPAGGPTPTGTVDFIDSGTTIGSSPVANDGSATFITTSLASGVHSITATYNGDTAYSASTSSAVSQTITGGSTATTHLAFTSQPFTGSAGAVFSPVVSVTIEDASNNVVTGDTSSVTLAIASPAGGASLGGTTTVAAVNGVATFTNLSINQAGSFTLGATDGSLTAATSATIAISSTPQSPIVPALGKVVLPGAVVADGKIKASFSVVITNTAAKASGTFAIELFASTSVTLDGSQTRIASLPKRLKLSTGKHASVNFHLSALPTTLGNGLYHIIARVTDPTGATNLVASTQTVTVAAPFVALGAATGAVTPAIIKVGKTGSVLLTVTNNGNIIAAPLLSVTLTPSIDGVSPAAGSIPTVLRKPAKILPGKNAKVRLHFKTAGLTAGNYVLNLVISLDGVTTTITSPAFTVS